jgi:hypothetical protein
VSEMGVVPDLDLRKIRVFCEEMTPPEYRDQMRVEVGVRGKSVTIFECRPPWPEGDAEWTRMPIGRLSTLRSQLSSLDPLLGRSQRSMAPI